MSSRPALSADEARTAALHAQGMLRPGAPRTVTEVLHRIAAIQLDSIAVLARSHELVPYARLGAVGRSAVEGALWNTEPVVSFEYWAHAACILPIGAWPYFAFRRRAERTKREAKPRAGAAALARVRDLLHAGPITATELGGARSAGGWSAPSEAKSAAETLYWTGEAACVQRRGFKRVYHLAERVVPEGLLAAQPGDEECYDYLVRAAVTAMGVATRRDIADYFRLRLSDVGRALARATDVVELDVAGWAEPAWTTEQTIAAVRESDEAQTPTVLVSPFDPLVWNRERTSRIFGITVQLEAYKPEAERLYGYFAMPILADGRLVGSLDPAREDGVLIARHLRLSNPSARRQAEQALEKAAGWVGVGAIRIEDS